MPYKTIAGFSIIVCASFVTLAADAVSQNHEVKTTTISEASADFRLLTVEQINERTLALAAEADRFGRAPKK